MQLIFDPQVPLQEFGCPEAVEVAVAVAIAVPEAVLVGVAKVKDKLQDPPYASGLLEGALGATEVFLV